MDKMTTYSGRQFTVFDPDIEVIDIVDIGHALSLLCRGNGHVKHFYSVAQHCLNCVAEAKARGYSSRIQLACLLHDATEAYMADLIRPIKNEIPLYREIENKLQMVIFKKYGIDDLVDDVHWKEIDDIMCDYDVQYLLNEKGVVKITPIIEPDIELHLCSEIEQRYVECFEELISEL